MQIMYPLNMNMLRKTPKNTSLYYSYRVIVYSCLSERNGSESIALCLLTGSCFGRLKFTSVAKSISVMDIPFTDDASISVCCIILFE